jgi:PAS domain S-box-containing protein
METTNMAASAPKQNQLLAALKHEEFMRLEHVLEPVEFAPGQMIYRAGEVIDSLYFPITLAASISVSGGNGESTSLAIVGKDGVLGFSAASGSERTPYDILAINRGIAIRLRRELAEWEFDQHSSLLWLVLRYGDVASFSFAQTAICNQQHSVEQRLCRWFLGIADKSRQSSFTLTHAFMAGQLGVRRAAISEAAAALQTAAAIEYSRGKVILLDLAKLRQRACTCGDSVREDQQQLPFSPVDTRWRYRLRPDPLSMRQLAEVRARQSGIPKPSSLSDYGRLVAELEVRKHMHDIQMEELIESYAEADRLRERYADIYDFAPVAYVSVDALGVLKQANLSAAILLGIKRSEASRHRFVDSVVAGQRESFIDFLKRVLDNNGHLRIEISLAATDHRPEALVIIDGIADEAEAECRMVITDVTKEKTYAQSLRRAYELLDMSHSAANAGSWDWDMVTGQLTWSANLFNLFGLDPARDTASFEAWHKVLHPDDLMNAEAVIQLAIRDHRKLLNSYRVVLPDGTVRWISSVGEAVYDNAGNPLRMRGICIDATRQMEAEAEIRRYAEKLRTVADFTYDWEYWQSPQGDLLYVSPSCERISGYNRDEFLSDPALLTKIVCPEDLGIYATHMEKTRGLSPGCEIDFRIIRKDGATRWVSHCCQPVHTEAGEYLGRRVSNRDVTANKKMEEQLHLWSESFMRRPPG